LVADEPIIKPFNRVAGKLLLEAAAAAHDRADRAQRLCQQLRAKAEGNTSGSSGGGGLLAGVLDRERQRTVRLLLSHLRDEEEDEYATAEGDAGGGGSDRRDGRAEKNCSRCWDCHDCCSDDEGVDAAAVADYCSADQEELTAAGIPGVPGLDVDRGVLIRRKYQLPTCTCIGRVDILCANFETTKNYFTHPLIDIKNVSFTYKYYIVIVE